MGTRSETPSKRSYAKLFSPRRLGLVLPLVPSSIASLKSRPRAPAPGKRSADSATGESVRVIEFVSPFASVGSKAAPTTSPTSEERLRPTCGRRLSSEERARLANGSRTAVVALETTPGKRRKSVVDLEEVTDGLQRASVTGRRRSSLTPLGQASAGPRSSFAFTPLDDSLARPEYSSPRPSRFDTSGTLPIDFEDPFPSPRSPVSASLTRERPCAFFDEVLTPGLASPTAPSSSSIVSSPSLPHLKSATASIWSQSSFRSLEPRSPRTAEGPTFAPDELATEPAFIRSPSGIQIRVPLVFPSRPTSLRSRSSRLSSVDTRATSLVDDEDGDDKDETDELVAVVAKVLARSEAATRTIPSFPSPFPPAFLSPTRRTVTADSFSKLTFPSMPTLFPDSVTVPTERRRPSVASSYHGDHVSTPSTFGPRRSVTETGFTLRMHDVFAEAFGAAGGNDSEPDAPSASA
ncbi:hypothetical protein DMC30DRAFT_2085 [Rhodotorula diobovata]|uniref:Uncharacterized protein n=1 Tax=Rhodotorula diobovata TaxID=5288 RepID=A0A5C5G8G5_9BASI|nr:hypothetical protein DMC30DRAFT_2085 [Rhodotorula diobovata]